MDASAAVLQIFRNILTIKQEDDQLRVIDLQVGSQVHNKVPGNLRTELWLSCLHRKGVGSGYASQYQAMLFKGVTEEAADDIEKDVGRTFPGLAKFATIEGKQALERVLRAYAAFDTEVNYCQGMNFLAALLLIWLPREADAFGALVLIMKDRGLRELYKTDMTMLQARLWQLGKIMPRHLARHMDQHCAIPVLYASSWLLTAFASDFPVFFSSRVMDIILADRYLEAMMKVVVGILKACEKRLLAMTDMEKMVDFLRGEVPRWTHDKLQELLTEALAAEWTAKQAAVLERTEGAESVVDAVQRVASNSPLEEDADEEEAKAAVTPAKSEPKLASFSWASKLSAASSTASSAGQPNLLQSLTGSLSGFGASLPSYYDAAKQMTSSSLSPLGDLLGLFESPKTSPEPAAAHISHTDSASFHPTSPAPRQRAEAYDQPSTSADAGDRASLSEGITRGAEAQQRGFQGTAERTLQGSGSLLGPGGPGRGSLGLASSSSWGPFHESEDAEADHAAGSRHARPDQATSRFAAARTGPRETDPDQVTRFPARSGPGGAEPDQAASGPQPDLAVARSSDAPELRWAAPRHGSGSLPTSPFQQSPRPGPFDAPVPASTGENALPPSHADVKESVVGGRLGSADGGSGHAGRLEAGGAHRPSRSDVDSLGSWGSFRAPDQAEAPNQAAPNLPGRPVQNDFLIRLSSAPSGHRSDSSERDRAEAASAGMEKVSGSGQATNEAQHLGQLDEDGCWNGCIPGGPDLISTEGSLQGDDLAADPFQHVVLTEPLSHAQMQRGDGGVGQKLGVSDWEKSQLSTFAAESGSGRDSRQVPMKKANSALGH